MIRVLDDPERKLGWEGTPAGPEMDEQMDEWAYGIFARWETKRQVRHLLAVGVAEAADILTLGTRADRELLLPLLPHDFRVALEALLTDPALGRS